MQKNEDAMLASVKDIMASAYKSGNVKTTYYANHVLEDLLLGRLYTSKFLQSNLSDDFEVAIENIEGSLRDDLSKLDENLQDPNRR